MPFRFLIINPNTSAWVTDALAAQIDSVLGPQSSLTIDVATAVLGASYIASEASYAIAGHALLDCFARHNHDHDAVVIGCFGDPGSYALQEISGLPVIGMAAAAMREAAMTGPNRAGRFAIVTGGAAWRPMLLRLAATLGFRDQLTDVVALTQSAADLARDRANALTVLEQACRQAHAGGATRIILGGAAFAGYGDELAERTGLPIIDSVSATARAMLSLAVSAKPLPARVGTSNGLVASYMGTSEALKRLLELQ